MCHCLRLYDVKQSCMGKYLLTMFEQIDCITKSVVGIMDGVDPRT